jgi:hypothetical protein
MRAAIRPRPPQITEQQGADMLSAALGIGPAYDNELLSVEALGLYSYPAVAGRIGLIGSL